MATAGGHRPPLRRWHGTGVGAACGRPSGPAPRFPPLFCALPLCVILSGAKNPFPPSLCVTGILPQSPSVTAPSKREPKTRDTDSSAYGLRMTGWGRGSFLCGARTTRRANRSHMATAGGHRPPLRRWHGTGVGAACGRPSGPAPRFPPLFCALPLCVILSGAKNPFPPSLCVTGILPQSPSVTAPSKREPKTRDTDSSACGLRMTWTGSVVLLFVWGATTRRANRFPMATAGGRRPPLPQCFTVLVGAAFGRPSGFPPPDPGRAMIAPP